MKVSFDSDYGNLLTVKEVMYKVAEHRGWKNIKKVTGEEDVFSFSTKDGKKGECLITSGVIHWDDGEDGFLFGDVEDADFIDYSFAEYFNATFSIWVRDSKDQLCLYFEG